MLSQLVLFVSLSFLEVPKIGCLVIVNTLTSVGKGLELLRLFVNLDV